jgi:hypothetical protein
MTRHSLKSLLGLAVFGLARAVWADGGDSGLDQKIQNLVQSGQPVLEALAGDKGVIQETLARNAKPLAADDAKALQARWNAATTKDADLAAWLANRSAAAFRKALARKGSLTKVFSLDKDGNVVGSAPKPHDFCHGFEPKFLDCYRSGKALVNPPALDLTSKKYSVQVSVPIRDSSGLVVGVLVGTFAIK